jgi:hypothetical protein
VSSAVSAFLGVCASCHQSPAADYPVRKAVIRQRLFLTFSHSGLNARARRLWKEAGLDRILMQEARHTYASLMIAAGVNIKAISTYMGHSSVKITWDRYGHLLPGNEAEAAAKFDEFLARSTDNTEPPDPRRTRTSSRLCAYRARVATGVFTIAGINLPRRIPSWESGQTSRLGGLGRSFSLTI